MDFIGHSNDNNDNLDIHSLENSINLITTELNDNIPKLLEDQDILIKIEEGTNSTSTLKSNNKADILLENFVNLNEHYDYDSEDENLLNMMDNVKIKNMPPFQKLEFKDVE